LTEGYSICSFKRAVIGLKLVGQISPGEPAFPVALKQIVRISIPEIRNESNTEIPDNSDHKAGGMGLVSILSDYFLKAPISQGDQDFFRILVCSILAVREMRSSSILNDW